MAYVAVAGGQEAIKNSSLALRHEQIKGESGPIDVAQIRDQLYLMIDRIMGEGALYAPDLAALAFKQSAGDVFEAAFLLRAFSTTQPRLGYSLPQSTENMRIIRRISAAFKEIPGGQILGPTSDYTLRLLNFALLKEDETGYRDLLSSLFSELQPNAPLPETFPKVVELLHREGLLACDRKPAPTGEIFDITRNALRFPAPRSAVLQAMARAETGGLLALAYSNMRGYGMIHPTVGELRVGWVPVRMKHPYTGEVSWVGEVKVTEAEVISECRDAKDGHPRFTLGYGLCFGHNETKAISMAVLDRSTQSADPKTPSEDQEFVLLHTDGIESVGFCNHFKLPHYVTFQSALDRLRRSQKLMHD